MNIEKENNTELFFKELKSKTCNLEILYNLSLKGIYLYKKIKYHEYVVDISLMNKQYFKIYNDRQYDRLIEKFEKYEGKNNTYNKNEYRQLIILNEYIIKKLVNDNNNSYILTLPKEHSHISLYCLLKYNYISYKIFDFFKSDTIYFKNINLSNISKYIGNYYVSSHMKIKFDKDIKVLENIIINLCNNIKYH
ncbi:hypothetical protein U3516DRAFT_842203 [Neocallimastix sp. 'constans']